MRLIVFGASGATGRQLVEQALAANHEVTAFVRNPARFRIEHPRLTVTQGDALDPQRVSAAIAGQDAVLYAIGTNRRSTLTVCTESTRHIIAAMKQHGMRRLVCLTAYGAAKPATRLYIVRCFAF